MPIEIISESRWETDVRFFHDYRYRDDEGAGFSFDCDENGNLLTEYDAARENYRKCVEGELDVVYYGMERDEREYRVPAVGRCVCGREVELDGHTIPCDCGREYNGSGQLLAPRSQWGEETGETEADILGPMMPGEDW